MFLSLDEPLRAPERIFLKGGCFSSIFPRGVSAQIRLMSDHKKLNRTRQSQDDKVGQSSLYSLIILH